jgi:hypothetical protein
VKHLERRYLRPSLDKLLLPSSPWLRRKRAISFPRFCHSKSWRCVRPLSCSTLNTQDHARNALFRTSLASENMRRRGPGRCLAGMHPTTCTTARCRPLLRSAGCTRRMHAPDARAVARPCPGPFVTQRSLTLPNPLAESAPHSFSFSGGSRLTAREVQSHTNRSAPEAFGHTLTTQRFPASSR